MRRATAVSFIAILTVTVATMAAPTVAQAQDKKVNVNLGGGYTVALSDVRDYLGDGYNINFGVTFNVNENIGIQAEYSFNGLGEKLVDLDLAGVNPPPGQELVRNVYANMNMQYGTFNLVFKPSTEGRAKPYVVTGLGVYYRPIKVTTPGAGYVPPYCSPWWYYCYPGGFVPVDYILAEQSSTDFGMNFGAGVDIAMTDAASFYLEARYHYILGPELKDQAGKSYGKATGQFLPITFGFRF